MNYEKKLGSKQWDKIYQYLQEFRKEIYVQKEAECQRFVEAVLWMARSGSSWRLLPKEYGNWNTVYKRFSDWSDKGIWCKMLYYFQEDKDMEYIMIDSTILRAHACATPKKTTKKRKD